MEKRRFWKISTAVCLAVLMLLAAYLPVLASETQAKTGSIQLQLPEGQKQVEMVLYSVADYKDGSYIFSGDFADCGIQITDLNHTQEAQNAAAALAEYALAKGISGTAAAPDEEGMVRFSGLSPALYLAVQSGGEDVVNIQPALVPIPFAGEEGSEIYDAVLSLKYSFPGGAVILAKMDDDGNMVGQVTFTLQEKTYIDENTQVPEGAEVLADEGGNYFWKEFAASLVTDENGQAVVTDMPFGDYRFVEVAAPDGLIMSSEPVDFSITKAGQVAVVDGVYDTSGGEPEFVTVVNEQTRVMVNKVDANGEPVPGAKLVVKSAEGRVLRDADNGVLFSFTSGEAPYELKRIPVGNYLLSEVEAPAGYKVSTDVPFTIDGTSGVVHEVTMVDEPEEETEASLMVTKRLTDMLGLPLTANDATFYVALFEDEERTKRVSSVQALHYQGNDADTVTFENLDPEKTYYVGETDEFGELMEGTQSGNGVFFPDFPDGYEITPSVDPENQHELTFANMYLEIPDGFFYVGKLTITKRVLKGTDDYNTDDVFYAGIFEDPEFTKLYDDTVIVLEMDGGCETSVTTPVFIGENVGDSRTYYVAETDEEGNVLDPDSGLEYTVSVDKTEVTLTAENSEQEVVITNTFEEETPQETPTPTPEEEVVVTPTNRPGTPNSHGGEGASPVRTGDDTPVGKMVAVLFGAVAVIAIAGAVIYRKKRR